MHANDAEKFKAVSTLKKKIVRNEVILFLLLFPISSHKNTAIQN